MKKLVRIAVVIAFAVLALTAILHYSSDNNMELRAIPPQFRFSIEIEAYDTEILDALLTVANSERIDLVRQVSYYDETEHRSIITDYVYTSSQYIKSCDVISGRMLGASDMDVMELFASTEKTNERDQIGQLYGFGNSLAYYVRPLKALVNSYEIKGVYHVAVSTQKEAEDFMKELIQCLNEDYNLTLEPEQLSLQMNASNSAYDSTDSVNILLYIRIAALSALLLLFAFSCIFFGKEISVLKVEGYSSRESASRTILRTLIWGVFVSLLIGILSMLVIDGFHLNLLLGVLPSFILYCFVELTMAAVIYLGYAAIVKPTQSIKGRAPIKAAVILNLTFYILISILCVGITSETVNNIHGIKHKTDNLSVWTTVQDYGVFFPVSSGMDRDAIRRGEYPLDIPGYEFFKYANKSENAIYAASTPFMEINAPYNTDILSRIFVVNSNYLSLFPIKDSSGENVHIDQAEQKSVYLIPERYRQQEGDFIKVLLEYRQSFHDDLHVALYEYDPMPLTREIKIIYIADDQDFFSINTDVEPANYNMIRNVIVQVLTDGNCLVPDINLFGSRPFLYIPLQGLTPADKKASLMNELKSNSLDDNLPNFIQPNMLIMQEIDELREQTNALLVVIAFFICLTLIAIYQAIASMFRLNEYKFFILLSLGRPKRETLRGILLPMIAAQSLIFVGALILFGWKSLTPLLIVQSVEIIIAFIMISTGEKKNILSVLKKGA